jgi:hypothetical protein
MNKASDIETLATRVVYENRWMRVREDSIRRRDGSDGIYGVIEKPDFVVIVPVEQDRRLHLVQQFRYPVGGRYWELPQGSWELAPDAVHCRSLLASCRKRPASSRRRSYTPATCFRATAIPRRATTSTWPRASAALKRRAIWRSRTSSRALSPWRRLKT